MAAEAAVKAAEREEAADCQMAEREALVEAVRRAAAGRAAAALAAAASRELADNVALPWFLDAVAMSLVWPIANLIAPIRPTGHCTVSLTDEGGGGRARPV